MKKFIIVLALAGIVAAAVYLANTDRSGPAIEPVYYFRTVVMPEWMPVSRGVAPGETGNPFFEPFRQDRHLVVIVSVPAGRLLEPPGDLLAEHQKEKFYPLLEDDDRFYPRFEMATRYGEHWPARWVAPWPKSKNITDPDTFTDDESCYPQPDENHNKRFHLAVYFRTTQKNAVGPFQIFMDDEPPVTFEQKDFLELDWGGLF